MSWKELTKENIEPIKDLYLDYLRKNQDNLTRFSFEDFIECEVDTCERCGNYEMKDDLVDTEGQVNGGIGNICLTCCGDM